MPKEESVLYKPLIVKAWGACHVGHVREENQDAFLSWTARNLWVVADGMGGVQAGEVASRMIVEALQEIPVATSLDHSIELIRHTLGQVNNRLRADITRSETPLFGSTVVVLTAFENTAACLWAGDSRCYLSRNGRLHCCTTDHSLCQEAVDIKGFTPSEARRTFPAHIITRAVGVSDVLELDAVTFEILPGDTLLLCTDGVYGKLDEDILLKALSHNDPKYMVEYIISSVLKGEAHDNLAAVIASFT